MVRLGIILSIALFCFSCEKILDIDLNEADSRIVIEADLIAGENLFSVKISRTANYFDNSEQDFVNDAEVTLVFEDGASTDIPFDQRGQYEKMIDAATDHIYVLSVSLDGQIYNATSYLPSKVEISELEPEFTEGTPQGDEGFNLFVRFSDPGGTANYYRLVHSVNNEIQLEGDDLIVSNDDLFDGGLARIFLFGQVFAPRSRVTVELVHFDEASFDYFNSLSDIVGAAGGPNGATAAPGNPNSNWSEGALGYFAAFSADQVSIIIPDINNNN